MFEATLSIPWDTLPNYCFLRPTKEFAGEHACLRVTSITLHNGKLRHLVEINGQVSRRVANLLAMPTARTSLHPTSSTYHLGEAESPLCPLYAVLSSTACFLINETVRREYLEWVVIARSIGVVDALVRKLRKSGVRAEMVRMERVNGSRRLTNRQEQILTLAYQSGFFESPHETSVRQLAAALDCSPSTLVRLLRKAEKKVIAEKLRA